MGNKKFNQIEVNKIIDLYNSGLLQREIADMFNTSKSSIGRCLRENGITSRVIISNSDIKDIISEYLNGYNIEFIAHNHNIGTGRVSKFLKENNINIRTADVYNRKYTLNENYFDIIDAIWAIHDSYVSSCIYGTYAKSVGKIDESLKTKVLEIKRFLSEYDKAVDMLADSGVYNDNYRYDNNYKSLLAKILIKNKSFMINVDVYKRIKHNQLINILCKK